jgi:hypothetical protein
MKPLNFSLIVVDNVSRYPHMQVEDLYKLAHQAAMGSEHSVSDIDRARQWMADEIQNLQPSTVEPMIDVISRDRSIVRVHLGSFIDAGGDPENLLQAFVQTANEFTGSTSVLRAYWQEIIISAERDNLHFPKERLALFFKKMEADQFPAIHHSAQYDQAYHPHYRVIAPRFLDLAATG